MTRHDMKEWLLAGLVVSVFTIAATTMYVVLAALICLLPSNVFQLARGLS